MTQDDDAQRIVRRRENLGTGNRNDSYRKLVAWNSRRQPLRQCRNVEPVRRARPMVSWGKIEWKVRVKWRRWTVRASSVVTLFGRG